MFSSNIEGACNRVPAIAETGIKSTVCGPGIIYSSICNSHRFLSLYVLVSNSWNCIAIVQTPLKNSSNLVVGCICQMLAVVSYLRAACTVHFVLNLRAEMFACKSLELPLLEHMAELQTNEFSILVSAPALYPKDLLTTFLHLLCSSDIIAVWNQRHLVLTSVFQAH